MQPLYPVNLKEFLSVHDNLFSLLSWNTSNQLWWDIPLPIGLI